MITTAFLFKVIIYGLIAAIIIPAIDFIVLVVRESRRHSPPMDTYEAPADEEAQREPVRRRMPDTSLQRRDFAAGAAPNTQQHRPTFATLKTQQQRSAVAATGTTQHRPTFDAPAQRRPDYASGAPAQQEGSQSAPLPRYIASNGVTITPTLGASSFNTPPRPVKPLLPPKSHPHAEYWCYGNERFYEHM